MKDLGDKEVYKDAWMLLGKPVFGGWLPYIGFRTMHLTAKELNDMGIPATKDVEYSPFVLEWFCKGVSFGRATIE